MSVYVDGLNLQHGIAASIGVKGLWLDVSKLARTLRPRSRVVLIRYFTSLVLPPAAIGSHQHEYLAALQAWQGYEIQIVSGRHQRMTRRCPECGARRLEYIEKETDVNLAAALLSDTAEFRMDAALVVSADADFAPAMSAAQRLSPTLFVAAAFPPARSSATLLERFPASFPIGLRRIRAAQLPDEFEVDGVVHRRPTAWGGS